MDIVIDRNQWIQNHNSESARKNARSSMKYFDVFLDSRNYKEKELFEFLRKSDESETFFIIRDIVIFLQRIKSYGTCRLYLTYVRSWFRENRLNIDERRMASYVKWEKPLRERKYTPDINVLSQILGRSNPKWRSYWLCLIATGMRQGEAMKLRVKDFDLKSDPIKIILPAQITKTKQERVIFLTPEAWESMQYRFINKSDNDLVFDDITTSALHKQFERIRKHLGIEEKYSTGRAKLTPHRLRAYVKKVFDRTTSSDISHVMLGHSTNLGTYDGDNDEGMKEDYKKAIESLTVDQTKKMKEIKERNQDMEERIKVLEQTVRAQLMKHTPTLSRSYAYTEE